MYHKQTSTNSRHGYSRLSRDIGTYRDRPRTYELNCMHRTGKRNFNLQMDQTPSSV